MDVLDAPILVVDDHAEMTKLAARLIERLGFRKVDQANDGPTALHLMRRKAYSLLLVDINMQPTSGPELIKAIQSDERHGKPAIIMMSGSNSPASIAQVKQLGVSGYLLKPFSISTLKQSMMRVFGM